MLRRARLGDVPAIVELAVEAVSRQPWPLKINREAMAESAKALISHQASFIAVVEDEAGNVQGCLAAETSLGFWFAQQQSVVLMCYCRKNLGAPLLRAYRSWLRSRPGIKLAVFTVEPGMDQRIGVLMKRFGFTVESTQYTYLRHAQGEQA